jgi:hypothetical protein
MLYWAWNKNLKIYPFVSWFNILSQYDANIVFLLGFGMVMQNPSKFEKICYGVHCISRITLKGIISVLCSFEHKQYPSSSVNLWCLITKYHNDCIGFLGGFGKAM